LDAKGLEFDAVIVPVHTRLDGMETAALNSLYVAFSRPRQHLAIVASADVEGPVFGRWMKEGLLERSAAST
jgi:ATP-dependent exoDNAse (exonuclease V) beta subunit